jgi:hypothetical protein
MLQDFLAWHAGATGGAALAGAPRPAGPGAPGPGLDLSAWREVFDRAPPLPAARQQPLLDAGMLAEEVLDALLGTGAPELLAQLALLLARVVLSGGPRRRRWLRCALTCLLLPARCLPVCRRARPPGGGRARPAPTAPAPARPAPSAGASPYCRQSSQLATAVGQAAAALEQLTLQAGGEGWARLDADSLDVLLGTLDAVQEVLLRLAARSAAGEGDCPSDDCSSGGRPAGAEGGEEEAWVLV